MKKIFLILQLFFFIAMVYVNFLSGTGRINGISAGGVSALYPTYFTPAGFTFSIWGIIYLSNFVFVLYAIIRGFQQPDGFPALRIIYLYIITCLVNIAWIYAWHYQWLILTVFLMTLLLVALLLIYREVTGRNKRNVSEYIFTVIPISLYTGWIVVALVADVAVMLTSLEWGGFGIPEHIWASVMVGVSALINVLILVRKKDIFFSLVFLWAAYGIIYARRLEGTTQADSVAVTALISMIAVFLFIIYARFFVIRKEEIKKN